MINNYSWVDHLVRKRPIKLFATLLVIVIALAVLAPAAHAGSSTPRWVKDLFSDAPYLENGRISTMPSIEPLKDRTPLSVAADERDFGEIPLWIKKLEVQNVGKASPYYNVVMGLSGR